MRNAIESSIQNIGKKLGIDALNIFRNTIAVTGVQCIAVLKGIATGYLVTRFFSPTEYGEYRFTLSIIGIVSFASLPGLPIAVGKAVARKEIFSYSQLIRKYSFFCSIGSIMLLGTIPFLHIWNKQSLWPLFLIAAIAFVPQAIGTSIFGGFIRGTGQFPKAFRVSAVVNISILIATVLMLILHPSTTIMIGIGMGIPAIIYIYQLLQLRVSTQEGKDTTDIFKRSLQLSFATIPSAVSWYIDGLLISAFFGLSQLATFSVSLLIPEQIKVWLKEIWPVVFNHQARGSDSHARRNKMHIAVLMGTLACALIITVYVMLAPWIVPILFPQYDALQVIHLTRITSLFLILAPSSLYPQYLEARGWIRLVQYNNWIASSIFIIALLVLVPTWGASGAIIARGIFRLSYVAGALIFLRCIQTEEAQSA